MPRYIIAPWDNYRFIFLAAFPVLFFGYLLLSKKNYELKIVPSDFSWFLFLAVGFLSYTWAANGALIWYLGFGWLALILWMIIVRKLSSHDIAKKYLSEILVIIFLLVLSHIIIVAIFDDLGLIQRWNSHFGHNVNFVTVYLVGLFPFLLFYEKSTTFFKWLKFIGTFLVIGILFYTSVRGALLGFMTILVYYIFGVFSRKILGLLSIVFFASLFLIGGILLYNPELANTLPIIKKFGYSGDSSRIFMVQTSIDIFKENPLKGIGLGNWYTQAYNRDLSNLSDFNHPFVFFRLPNHNLYSQLLAELGLIGFIAFLFPILSNLVRSIFSYAKLSNLQKAATSSILVYLVGALVYRDVSIYEFHFSSLHLLAFFSLGILGNHSEKIKVSNQFLKWIFLGSSICCLIWFIFYKWNYDSYLNMLSAASKEKLEIEYYDSHLLFDKNKLGHKGFIGSLEELHHPIFKTSHGFYNEGYQSGANESLTLKIAIAYQDANNTELAENYFLQALKEAPHNEYILMAISKFYLRRKQNIENAKKYALEAYAIQNNNFDINLLLTEIAIIEAKPEDAKKYLNEVKETTRLEYIDVFTLLQVEIALLEEKYQEANSLLIEIKKKKHRYQNLVKNLQLRLNQNLQSPVQ